jgi:hypothetical protein
MRAEPLERERRLGVGRLRRERLADRAELDGRDGAVERQDGLEHAARAEGAHEVAVDTTGLAPARGRHELRARELPQLVHRPRHRRHLVNPLTFLEKSICPLLVSDIRA